DELATSHAERTERRRSRLPLLAFGGALAAAAAMVIYLARHREVPAPLPSPSVEVAAEPPALLEPYLVAGPPSPDADRLLSGRFPHLEAPRGGMVRASLAGRARLTLVGPATLDVVAEHDGEIELKLGAGLLLCDYDHSAGGALVVHSPGAVTRVVGTLFSIEALRAE